MFRRCIEPSRQTDRCFHFILDGNYFSTSRENKLVALSNSPGFFKAVFLNCSLLNLYWEKYTQFILAFLCLLCAFLLGESSLISESIGQRIIKDFYWHYWSYEECFRSQVPPKTSCFSFSNSSILIIIIPHCHIPLFIHLLYSAYADRSWEPPFCQKGIKNV